MGRRALVACLLMDMELEGWGQWEGRVRDRVMVRGAMAVDVGCGEFHD